MVKRVLLIVPQDDFSSQTFMSVRDTLDESGIAVFTGSTTLEACVAEDGLIVKPDLRVAQIKGTDWDAILFLSGPGSAEYWLDSTAHLLCQVAWSAEKVVGGIGPAVVTLANSGILTDLRVAVGPSWEDAVTAKGGIVSKNPVEVDGNVVTASDDSAAQAFAGTIVDLLLGRPKTGTVAA